MHWLYVIALLPVIAGFFAWVFSEEISLLEWGGAAAAGFLVAGCVHLAAFYGMVGDTETWSGQITHARQFSAWREYYEEAVYRTETRGSGKNKYTVTVFDHWESHKRWHDAYWECYSNIGTTYRTSQADFEQTSKLFKDRHAVKGDRTTFSHASRMIGGDPNDYVASNVSGFLIPITDRRKFENRIKAAPSTFSFQRVPKAVKVYDYPENSDPFHSGRLLGTAAADIDLLAFDQMNARLGVGKHVNVILVGFGDAPAMISEYQKAKWVGGKKNDLVVCYGKGWARCFGWTEKELCKRNIEMLFETRPINTDILPLLEQEVQENYVIRDWKQFDYIAIEPPLWAYLLLVFCMAGTQALLWFYFQNNELCRSTDIDALESVLGVKMSAGFKKHYNRVAR